MGAHGEGIGGSGHGEGAAAVTGVRSRCLSHSSLPLCSRCTLTDSPTLACLCPLPRRPHLLCDGDKSGDVNLFCLLLLNFCHGLFSSLCLLWRLLNCCLCLCLCLYWFSSYFFFNCSFLHNGCLLFNGSLFYNRSCLYYSSFFYCRCFFCSRGLSSSRLHTVDLVLRSRHPRLKLLQTLVGHQTALHGHEEHSVELLL